MDRTHFVTAYAQGAPSIEFYNIEYQKSRIHASTLSVDKVRDITEDAKSWLPLAAEELNISSNLKDYILVPTISMPSDLPNKNHQAFPLEQLTAWCVDHGMPVFQTWKGQPAHIEHQNQNPREARGIILDACLLPIKNSYGGIWKLLKLVAWDRNKDPSLANSILAGTRSSYSMGANCRFLECSICGSRLGERDHCSHVDLNSKKFNIISGRLAYYNVISPVGIEISSVAFPAYLSAQDNKPLGVW